MIIFLLHLIKAKIPIIPLLIGIGLCCSTLGSSDWLTAWMVGENHCIVGKYPVVMFPRLRSDNGACLELQCTVGTVGMVGQRCRRCGGRLWDRDLGSWGWGVDVASVAAVIKLSAVEQAGRSVSVCSVSLWSEGQRWIRPVLSVLLSSVAEWITAKPSLNTFTVTTQSRIAAVLWLFVASWP